jgi:quinolinate synthase
MTFFEWSVLTKLKTLRRILERMEITISPELEALIAKKMASGHYESVEQLLLETLRQAVEVDETRDQALAALKQMFTE